MMISKKKASVQTQTETTPKTNPSPPSVIVMKKSSLRNHERHLKWEKHKVDKAVNQLILAKALPIAETLIDIGLTDRNPNVLNSLLDRAFGKARQNIGLDGGAEDKPIVFMPAQLMAKYAIKAGTYKELKNPGDDSPTGMQIDPLTEDTP